MSEEPKTEISIINQLISDHYSHLTKSEKRIADFILKNQEESAFLSVGEMARRLGIK